MLLQTEPGTSIVAGTCDGQGVKFPVSDWTCAGPWVALAFVV